MREMILISASSVSAGSWLCFFLCCFLSLASLRNVMDVDFWANLQILDINLLELCLE